MFRYFTLFWSLTDARQREAAQLLARRLLATSTQWHQVFDCDGMRVYCAGARPRSLRVYELDSQLGVVLGTLFEHRADQEDATASRGARLSRYESEQIDRTAGRRLVSGYWGNYVAFLRDPGSRAKRVIKDPTGTLPCYRTAFRGVHIFFSCLADCVGIDLLSFTVNWKYVTSHLLSAQMNVEEQALNEVTEVYRGECLELDPGREAAVAPRTFYWNPATYRARGSPILDPDKAACVLRSTVSSCTASWATCHDSILHRLSGGLDSSIVLGCLHRAQERPRITCWTYYDPNGLADPRPWARLAASSIPCEHIEIAMPVKDLELNVMSKLMPSVVPHAARAYLAYGPVHRKLAAGHRASAIFSGDGGDNIFGSVVRYVVDDFLSHRGVRPDVLRLAARVAIHNDQLIWKVLAKSGLRWLRGYRVSDQREMFRLTRQLLNPELVASTRLEDHYPHPWFDHVKDVPWKLISRLGMLLYPPEFYDLSSSQESDTPEIVNPLYSQPLVEACFGIPTHILCENGRERGLARRAFAGHVPDAILRRLWKDRSPRSDEDCLHRNIDYIRTSLLDGILVQNNFLDRRALEEILSGNTVRGIALGFNIWSYLDLEIWLRRWTGYRASTLAA